MQIRKGYGFNDLLLVPKYSGLNSRKDADISSKIGGIRLEAPIISANMDTITEYEMASKMSDLGGLGVLHRFMEQDKLIGMCKGLRKEGKNFGVAIGLKNYEEFIPKLTTELIDITNMSPFCMLVLDIAHGHSNAVKQFLKWYRDYRDYELKYKGLPNYTLCVGNVAIQDAVNFLCSFGVVDVIKVGIGPGAVCLTRNVTGFGVPQASAIDECSKVAHKYGVDVIGDGGIRTTGDMVKAFALGADAIMMGSLFAGCPETPGEIKGEMKVYRGMGSNEASGRDDHASEGTVLKVVLKDPVEKLIGEWKLALKSGFSYAGARNLKELQAKAEFVEISPLTYNAEGHK